MDGRSLPTRISLKAAREQLQAILLHPSSVFYGGEGNALRLLSLHPSLLMEEFHIINKKNGLHFYPIYVFVTCDFLKSLQELKRAIEFAKSLQELECNTIFKHPPYGKLSFRRVIQPCVDKAKHHKNALEFALSCKFENIKILHYLIETYEALPNHSKDLSININAFSLTRTLDQTCRALPLAKAVELHFLLGVGHLLDSFYQEVLRVEFCCLDDDGTMYENYNIETIDKATSKVFQIISDHNSVPSLNDFKFILKASPHRTGTEHTYLQLGMVRLQGLLEHNKNITSLTVENRTWYGYRESPTGFLVERLYNMQQHLSHIKKFELIGDWKGCILSLPTTNRLCALLAHMSLSASRVTLKNVNLKDPWPVQRPPTGQESTLVKLTLEHVGMPPDTLKMCLSEQVVCYFPSLLQLRISKGRGGPVNKFDITASILALLKHSRCQLLYFALEVDFRLHLPLFCMEVLKSNTTLERLLGGDDAFYFGGFEPGAPYPPPPT